jgi:hypothetical protein
VGRAFQGFLIVKLVQTVTTKLTIQVMWPWAQAEAQGRKKSETMCLILLMKNGVDQYDELDELCMVLVFEAFEVGFPRAYSFCPLFVFAKASG